MAENSALTGRVLTGRAQRMGWGVQGGGRDIPGKKTKGTGLGKPVDTNSPDPCNSAAPVWFLGRVASVSPENLFKRCKFLDLLD